METSGFTERASLPGAPRIYIVAGKVNDRGNPDHSDRSAGEIDVEKEQYRLLDEVLIIPSVWKIEDPTGYVLVGSFFILF
ncbi:hypothetical protein AM231_06195 [Paenibacillus solani]|uniref:Uncharacterized protein n=1 Tax=Paenibacillus solani TaxID=1705565 RepID=A0A0M1P426_9BACL|nr:hypothetical protein AM231_06195 [Paenibacillus solani]